MAMGPRRWPFVTIGSYWGTSKLPLAEDEANPDFCLIPPAGEFSRATREPATREEGPWRLWIANKPRGIHPGLGRVAIWALTSGFKIEAALIVRWFIGWIYLFIITSVVWC